MWELSKFEVYCGNFLCIGSLIISSYQCLLLEHVRELQLWQYFGDRSKGTVCLIF
jgi:hypothetical protein